MASKKNFQPPDYWQEHIEAWAKSGLSQTDYCQQNQIAKSTFYKWRKRLSNSGANTDILLSTQANNEPQDFMDLSVASEALSKPEKKFWDIELQLGLDIVLRMRQQ